MVKETPAAFGDTYESASQRSLDGYKDKFLTSPMFGAFKDDKLIGTAGYFIQPREKCQYKAYMWSVFVKPEYRRQNISYDMTLAVLESLPDEIELIQLDVLKETVSAYKTYIKAGFEDWGFEKKAVKINDKYYDLIHMVKFLR